MAELKGRADVRGTTAGKRADVRGKTAPTAPTGAPGQLTAEGPHGIMYGNGPVVSCLGAYPVFVGTNWQDSGNYVALAAEIQSFFRDLFKSTFGSILNQYGYRGGVFVAAHFEGAPSSSTLDDHAVAQIVAGLHASGVIPDDTANQGNSITAHAAFVYLDDSVTFNDKTSLQFSFCAPELVYGYHWYNTALRPVPIYYGVISNMSDACVQGDPYMTAQTQLARLTIVTSHELAELVSDPQPWTGWNSPSGEIGDICEGLGNNATITVKEADGTSNSWTVQTIYSLYDDEQGQPYCVGSSAAPAWNPPAAAVAAAGQGVGAQHANAAAADALLPLPPTQRVGSNIIRKPEHVYNYARRVMAGLPHGHIHGQLPALLREAADVLEKADKWTGK